MEAENFIHQEQHILRFSRIKSPSIIGFYMCFGLKTSTEKGAKTVNLLFKRKPLGESRKLIKTVLSKLLE